MICQALGNSLYPMWNGSEHGKCTISNEWSRILSFVNLGFRIIEIINETNNQNMSETLWK